MSRKDNRPHAYCKIFAVKQRSTNSVLGLSPSSQLRRMAEHVVEEVVAEAAMCDKNNTEIVVGCRVREDDSDFGEGVVKSIEVPCIGGAFNVGVEWDDAEKGGPPWTPEGGGRGAQHLVVIQAAGGVAADGADGEKLVRFRERFGRDMRESEAELSERGWDEIEEEEEKEEDGGEKEKDGGGGGGEGGEEEEGQDAADAADHAALIALVTPGNRIRVSFGIPAKWYGGLVFDAGGDSAADEAGEWERVVAFDDGDLIRYGRTELQQMLACKGIAAAEAEHRGIIDNKSGYPMASSIVYSSFGGTGARKAVGVAVGQQDFVLGLLPTYMGYVVADSMFPKSAPAPATPASRTTRGKDPARAAPPPTNEAQERSAQRLASARARRMRGPTPRLRLPMARVHPTAHTAACTLASEGALRLAYLRKRRSRHVRSHG